MTTMAWDGRYVAIDSRTTIGDLIASDSATKIFRGEGFIATGCGEAAHIHALVRWHQGEIDWPAESDWQFAFWVFRRNDYREYVSSPHWTPLLDREASGSGREVAMTAMHLGHGARAAVEAAARLDVFTGGEVHVFEPGAEL